MGEKIVEGGFIERCIKTRQEVEGTVERSVYGSRLRLWVAPLLDEDTGEIVGTYGVYVPKLHPVAKAFDIFAPIVANVQPEGAWIGVTDPAEGGFPVRFREVRYQEACSWDTDQRGGRCHPFDQGESDDSLGYNRERQRPDDRHPSARRGHGTMWWGPLESQRPATWR